MKTTISRLSVIEQLRMSNCNSEAEQTVAELMKALEGVLHHNAATKPEYQLPQSLVRHVEQALAKARG